MQFSTCLTAFSAGLKTQVQKAWASAKSQEQLTIVVAAEKLNFSLYDALGESGSVIARKQKMNLASIDCVPPERTEVESKITKL